MTLTYQRQLIPLVNQLVDSYEGIQFNQTLKESLYLRVMCIGKPDINVIRALLMNEYKNLQLFAKSITRLEELPSEPHYNTIDDLIKDFNDNNKIDVKEVE